MCIHLQQMMIMNYITNQIAQLVSSHEPEKNGETMIMVNGFEDLRLYNQVTIFQLTNFVRDIQVIITEFLLWDMWHYTKKYGSKDKPFVVVLDEAQNLSHTLSSPSGMILTEGRKFGWSAWYATQSLKVLSEDEILFSFSWTLCTQSQCCKNHGRCGHR